MKRLVYGIIALMTMLGCAPPQPEPPKLVIWIVVDQMRADYLERFDEDLTGGLRRLLDEGVYFSNANFGHAMTGTAAGHATLVTGTDPSQHGIWEKEWFDFRTKDVVSCSLDPMTISLTSPGQRGESPRHLLTSTVGDWLKAASPQSKVYAVALKPRAAIMMGGHRADGAFWLSPEQAIFTTSSYYLDEMPAWTQAFNARDSMFRFDDVPWELSAPSSVYEAKSREDSFEGEAELFSTTFPHDFHADPAKDPAENYAGKLRYSPFGDELSIEFVRRLAVAESIGLDDAPDMMFVGLSSADYVGHLYGPLSQEVQDYYLRMDRYLGAGLAELDAEVGAGNYLVVLTADHGVALLPEEAKRRGMDAGRIVHQEYQKDLEATLGRVAQRLGLDQPPVRYVCHEGIYLDYDAMADHDLLERTIKEELESLEYVRKAYPRAWLRGEKGSSTDPFLENYRRSWAEGRAPDLMMLFRENWAVDAYPGGTDHGTPYRYDTHVPLFILGGGLAPRVVRDAFDMVDLAPTVADLLRIEPAEDIRGRSWLDQIR